VATAGTLPIKDSAGKLQATVFYVAYTKEPSENLASRPITFAFNGGPGASAVFLHLGALGPKRVPLADAGTALPQVVQLVDNPSTWLDFTDLVFVDPIGTGYSRAAEGVDPKQYYDVQTDIRVASAFVRRYVTQFGRWLSPKFVVGESYGATRAAGLAVDLQDSAGLYLDGLLLISSALNFSTFTFRPGNDLPYALTLPSYTATAWYHKRLDAALQADLSQTLREVEQWAMSEYLVALARGETLTAQERAGIVERLARYTGLDREFIERSRLRIDEAGFSRRLLRPHARFVARLDGRVVGLEMSPPGEPTHSDPALFTTIGPYVTAFNDYVRKVLNYETDLRYEFLSDEVNQSWKWSGAGRGNLYMGDDLAQAMTRDKRLRVFAAAGYYDLATPYLAQKYTFDHLEIDPRLRANLTYTVYTAGHQLYTDPGSLEELKEDAAAFVSGARRDSVAPEGSPATGR
jgi:carboxypeptidase C (cathepsin A)